ncbi:MAG: phosphatase PAP2 family protein, partial [Bdellovibrionales bacterium]|nr:phosphatase PAP2 family protein [Bdellovibrionales bacterium]
FLVATDYETWQESKRFHDSSELSRELHIKFVGGGDGYSHFGTALAFAGWGYLGENKRAMRTASQIVEAMLATGAVVQIMKHVTGRQSPFKTDDTRTGRWELFPEQVKYTQNVQNYDAVPSGHIATAYSTFYVIKENYPEQKWISWIGYPAIALISEGLAGTSIHWWSDIPIGIALGHTFAEIVVRRNNKNKDSEKSTAQIVPVWREEGPIMGVSWEW